MSNFILDARDIHENTQFWKGNTEKDYSDCIQGLIKSKPFGDHKFYIFSFVKRVDDVSGIKKMYHQPRLTRPDPLPGTTLMKCDPRDPEVATIIWTLPDEESMGMYKYGKIFADPFVHECIDMFFKNRAAMVRPDPDDMSEEQIKEFYKDKGRKRNFRVRTSSEE